MIVTCLNCETSFDNSKIGICPVCVRNANSPLLESQQRTRIPAFIETLDKMKELHLKKNEDYAKENDPYSNFRFTEFVLSQFRREIDKSFVWPIATKLARLSQLLFIR